jgi:acyl carrier protein
MITLENVRDVVTECLSMGGEPVEVGLDSDIVIDSFSLVWIQHVLEERYEVEIAPAKSDLDSFTSVRSFHAYLVQNFPDRVAVEG